MHRSPCFPVKQRANTATVKCRQQLHPAEALMLFPFTLIAISLATHGTIICTSGAILALITRARRRHRSHNARYQVTVSSLHPGRLLIGYTRSMIRQATGLFKRQSLARGRAEQNRNLALRQRKISQKLRNES